MKNAWNERRKLDGQIKDGGIKRNGCEDRYGKVVRGRGAHVVVIKWDIVRRRGRRDLPHKQPRPG